MNYKYLCNLCDITRLFRYIAVKELHLSQVFRETASLLRIC
jgi:hypothetical protein